MGVLRESSSVYEIASYYVIWCPRHRRNLPAPVQRSLGLLIHGIAEARGWEVKELDVMPDHVHLFIGAPPTESPVGIIKALKGTTAKLLFGQHPDLRTMFRHGRLWSPSYHAGTAGHVFEEPVARYVRDQKLRTPGRPKLSASSPQ